MKNTTSNASVCGIYPLFVTPLFLSANEFLTFLLRAELGMEKASFLLLFAFTL